jgi:cell division transport system ATP-binding protein
MDLFVQFNDVGVTLLVATHDVELAARYGRRTLTLRAGHLVADGGSAA